MKRGREGRAKTVQEFENFEEYRREIKRIKERSIAELERLLELFSTQATRKGARIFLARDAKSAVDYIIDVASRRAGKTIVKSKSLTSEEIEMNEPLEKSGYHVYETDLGEWIIQEAREKPYHLVFPAIHKTSREVAELFSSHSNQPLKPDLQEIMTFVRSTLREVFLSADIGVSGANVAVAESGTVVVETNEGNARLVTSIPRTHIVIMGMEKIVERFEDALPLIKAHGVSATGQRTTTYVSLITGRSPLAGDHDREMHIVILDNGRSRMREDTWFREALHCIRCGACMNICAPYGASGGHVFGYIYPGPIGIPWTANVHGLDKAKFAHLCISCGLCKEICPVDIDIPMMIAKVKQLDVEKYGQPLVNRVLEAYETIAPLASSLAPIWNRVMQMAVTRILLEKIVGIERRRPLPQFRRQTFTKWWQKHAKPPNHAHRKAALFVDFFANYVDPQPAISLVRLLEGAGVQVTVPRQKTSGYPYISYGDLGKAEAVARQNTDSLYPLVADGYDVVSLEPTATYALRLVYPKLLGQGEKARSVAVRSFEASEYLWMLAQQGKVKLNKTLSGRAGLHIPCHERALSSGSYTLGLLRQAGLDVEVRETGMCCGMAGTFGLKKGALGYDLSVAIGRPLFELFKDVDFIVTESGICKIQLQQGTGLPVLHPLILLGQAVTNG